MASSGKQYQVKYTPNTGAAEMFLHIDRKFTMEKLKPTLLS